MLPCQWTANSPIVPMIDSSLTGPSLLSWCLRPPYYRGSYSSEPAVTLVQMAIIMCMLSLSPALSVFSDSLGDALMVCFGQLGGSASALLLEKEVLGVQR